MPELPNRDEFETAIEEALAKVSAPARRIILRALGDPPRFENLTSDIWAELEGLYAGVLLPQLERVFLAGAQALQNVTAGVSWELVNEAAAQWARRYTFDLVRGIMDTTRRLLQGYIEDWYRTPSGLPDLVRRLEPLFGRTRARSIAITETTRASVEGERAVVRQLEREGLHVRLVAIWQTVNDDRVCPICGPLHNKEIEEEAYGLYPPAHPGCRCFVSHEVEIPNAAG